MNADELTGAHHMRLLAVRRMSQVARENPEATWLDMMEAVERIEYQTEVAAILAEEGKAP